MRGKGLLRVLEANLAAAAAHVEQQASASSKRLLPPSARMLADQGFLDAAASGPVASGSWVFSRSYASRIAPQRASHRRHADPQQSPGKPSRKGDHVAGPVHEKRPPFLEKPRFLLQKQQRQQAPSEEQRVSWRPGNSSNAQAVSSEPWARSNVAVVEAKPGPWLDRAAHAAFSRQRGQGRGPPAQQQWPRQRMQQQQQQQQQKQQQPQAESVTIPQDVTLIRLASLLGTTPEQLESVLRDLGDRPQSYEDIVAPDSAELAALEFGKLPVLAASSSSKQGAAEADAEAQPRPAVVTVMGHVDHGKTTLLDALRRTSVAQGEAGGITQHIGAFLVRMPGSQQALTFLDTPGHAAFTALRARGAAVTDLVVLVVAADDGVMPQTVEAIAHARAAGCPIVVAITKCDLPGAEPQRVRRQLLAQGLELEDAGGSVQVVEIAAPKGQGLDTLEEALLLQAELLELRASSQRRPTGVVVEARLDKGQGPVATVIVRQGALRTGQVVVVGREWGKVRSLRGTGGQAVQEVLPGQPAEVTGLRGLPCAGDELMAVDSEVRAQAISRARTHNAQAQRHATNARPAALANGSPGPAAGSSPEQQQQELALIIKADVQGSLEAVRDAVLALPSEHVRVNVVHAGVGPVSLSDVQLASPLGAKVLGFNVRTAGAEVDAQAKQQGLDIRCQRVIYHLLEEASDLIAGATPRVEHQVTLGTADVLQIFTLKGGRGREASTVAGCRVTDGSIKGASALYRVLRGGKVVHEGRCASLKRHKLDVETVGKGTECGVVLEGFTPQPGDVLECTTIEMRPAGSVST